MKKLMLFAGLLVFGSLGNAQETTGKDGVIHPEIAPMTFLGKTEEFRNVVIDDKIVHPITKPPKYGHYDRDDWFLNKTVNPNALPKNGDPIHQKEYSQSTHRSTQTANWQGITTTTMPGDPALDVGPNHVVQMLNGSTGARVQIWDKSGNILLNNSLFGTLAGTTPGGGDPIVLYDQRADRWILSEFCSGCNDMYIAVSTTPDPLGSYYTYSVTATSFPDYPKYSIWDDTYLITSNENTATIYALDRASMLAGTATNSQKFTMTNFGTIGFQAAAPVSLMGTTVSGGPALLMRMRDDAWTGSASDGLEMWELNINWANPGAATLSQSQVLGISPHESELCGYTSFECIPQAGSGTVLDPLREILMNRVMYRNFGTHESIVCCHVTDVDGNDLAGIRWYELRRSGGAWSVYQEGTYSPDANHRWMPTIGLSASGNIGLAYNVSSSSIHPEIRYTGRKECDPLGVMTETEVLLVDGTSPNNSFRYGDYNSMSVDPSDGETFWFTAMYNPASQARTRVGAFKIDNCSPTVQFTNSTYSPNESDATVNNNCLDYTVLQVPIQIGSDPTQPAGITINVTGGTATQGVDYDISNTTFDLDDPTLSASAEIWIYNDDIVEGTETITLDYTLNTNGGNSSAGTINQTVTISIADDDLAPIAMVTTSTILSQDFESGMAPFTTVNGSGNTPFQIGNVGTTPNNAYAIPGDNTTEFAWLDDDDCNCDQNDVDLLFPSIDLSNFTGATLNMDSYYENNNYNGDQEVAEIRVSIGGGAFTTVASVIASSIDVAWSSQTVDLTPYVGNADVQFAVNYSDATGWLYGCAIDNVVITGTSPIGIRTAVNTTVGDEANLGPNQTVHFYDPTTSDVMMTIENTSSFDYGCVTVEVDRDGSAPTATEFASSSVPDYLHSKTYTVTPTNSNPTGTYNVTVYYEEAEVAAWETFTGNTRNSLEVIKVAGNNRINDVTPANYGSYTIDNVVATMGAFNSDLTFSAGFTNGFSGFGLGIYNITTITVTHTAATTNVTCNGASDGTIVVTASGGTAPYQYSIDGGTTWQVSNTFTGLSDGPYDVIAQDAGTNQSTVSTEVITQPGALSYSSSASNLTCNGSANGTITLTASGGTSPYQYSINGGTTFQTSGSFTGQSAASYSIVVEDANSCQTTGSITLTEPTSVTHTLVSNNLTCNGSGDGSIVITASGGTGSLQYSIDGGTSFQASNSFTSLAASTYNVVVEDANSCQSTESVTLTEPNSVSYSDNPTNLSCNGSADGSILLTGSGGTGAFEYSIDGGTTFQVSGLFSSLTAATYNIVVEDVNNCQATGTITLTEPTGVSYTVSSSDPTCNGGNDGSISFSASGGPNPVTYSIDGGSNFQGNSNFNGLASSTYNLVVKDGNGCEQTQSLTLSDPLAVSYTASTAPENCGAADGSITLSASGGDGSYQYSVDGGSSFQASNAFASLTAGIYNIVIEDGNNCQTTGSQTVGNIGGANITNLSNTDPSCAGGTDASITITASGGTGSLQYSINGGTTFQASDIFSSVGAGVYNVVVEDGNSCQTTASVTVTDPLSVSYTAVTTDESCGQSNGTISFTASGGTGALQYSIDGGTTFQASDIFAGLSSGAYNVVVEDINGCQATGTENIATGSGPVVNSVLTTDPLCNGDASGSIFIAASGGSGSLQYSNNNGSTFQASSTFTGLVAGTYNLVVEDAGGCQTTTTGTLTAPTLLTHTISSTDVTCNGGNDGAITLAGAGGTGAYQYSINGGVSFVPTGSFTGLNTGNYSYIVEDVNGCQNTGSVTIAEPTAIVINSSSTNPICNGDANGTISLSATGGSGFYQFSIDGGTTFQSSGTFNGLNGGTYNLVAEDINSCQAIATVTIAEPNAITFGVSTSAVSCNGGSDGAITITGSGGTGSLQYSIDGGTSFQNSGLFNGVASGSYSIEIVDDNSCMTTGSVTVTEPTSVTYTSVESDPMCNGGNDGSIVLTGSGGTGALQYSINAGVSFQSSGSFTGLASNTYAVVVEDANGCQASGNISLTDPAGVTYSVSSTTENCGLSDGSLVINASGGSSPLEYSIDNGTTYQASNIFNSLSAGVYNLVIRDDNNCEASGSTSVSSSSGVSIANTSFVEPTCNGDSDGSVVVTAAGGAAPLQYSLDNGATFQATGTFSGAAAGSYSVVVEDATGCQVAGSVLVTEPNAMTYTSTVANENCGLVDGGISISVTGGASPYQYSIDGGTSFQSGNSFTSLSAGTYSIVVTDVNACQVTGSETIIGSGGASIDAVTANDPSCNGSSDGSLVITSTGGSSPVSYSIDGGVSFQSSGNFNGLSAGSYSIVVEDAAGCQNTSVQTLSDPTVVTLTSTSTSESCGAQDGTIAAVGAGGTGPYQYSIDGGVTFQSAGTFSGLSAGAHSITVEDANGCQGSGLETVNGSGGATINSVSFTEVSCFGTSDGTITISASGGASPLEYSVDGGSTLQSSDSFSGLSAGSYVVVVEDANGCQELTTQTISSPSEIVTSVTIFNATCGNNDGSAIASATGGNGGYTYLWDDALAQTSQTAINLSGGFYTVTVTDMNGCSTDDIALINNIGEPDLTLAGTDVSCYNDSDGVAIATVIGGSAPITYQWNDANNQTGATATNLTEGTYVVVVTDALNCVAVESITIREPDSLTLTTSVSNTTCADDNGLAMVMVEGGTSPYSYQWDDDQQQSFSSAVQLAPGTYNVIVTDVFNCESSASASIQDSDSLLVTVDVVHETCFERFDGSVTTQVEGGSVPYSYLWSTGDTTEFIENLTAGSYILTVEDANECTSFILVPIEELGDNCITIPTAISPNGDGANDLWNIEGLDDYPDAVVEIFNRWGSLIYSSNEYNNDWGGTFNGQDVPAGVYYFVITISEEEVYTGSITVLR